MHANDGQGVEGFSLPTTPDRRLDQPVNRPIGPRSLTLRDCRRLRHRQNGFAARVRNRGSAQSKPRGVFRRRVGLAGNDERFKVRSVVLCASYDQSGDRKGQNKNESTSRVHLVMYQPSKFRRQPSNRRSLSPSSSRDLLSRPISTRPNILAIPSELGWQRQSFELVFVNAIS